MTESSPSSHRCRDTVELGVPAFPFRVGTTPVSRAVEAEAAGADAVWFSDDLVSMVSPTAWRADGGPLARAVPDPHHRTDPFVAAAGAMLACRRARIGISGIDRRRQAVDVVRAAASLAEMGPDRLVLALRADGLGTDAAATGRRALLDVVAELGTSPTGDGQPGGTSFELLLASSDHRAAEAAGSCGAGWLPSAAAVGPVEYSAGLARLRRAGQSCAPVAGAAVPGLVVHCVIHPDAAVADAALSSRLVRARLAMAMFEARDDDRRHVLVQWARGAGDDDAAGQLCDAVLEGDGPAIVPHGTPDQVVRALEPYVDGGARRLVLDNLAALGCPGEQGAADEALAATLRLARLTFRAST
ncbi:MAG: hypothetical protein ACRD2C_05410 [Acidimicrobiales bacterium]